MSNPTRFTSGVATVANTETLGNYPLSDPFHSGSINTKGVCEYRTDFNSLDENEYTVTGTSSTFAQAVAAGGVAVLTPGGTTTASSAYKAGQHFQFIAGNRAWFNTRVQASAVSGTKSLYVGLQAGSSANDGIWFAKAASTTNISLVSVVGSTTTTLLSNVGTIAAATWVDLGFYFDGTDLLVYVNSALVARVSGPTIGSSATTLTNAVLTPVFQITPTATDTLSVDFVLASQEITR